MRPASHRDQEQPKRCGNCRHAIVPRWKQDLLCFHGDDIKVEWGNDVWLCGESVGLTDGDEYDKVWAGRVVFECEVCDEWAAREAVGGDDE